MRRIVAVIFGILVAQAACGQEHHTIEARLLGVWVRTAAQSVDWLKTAGGRTAVVETHVSEGRTTPDALWRFNQDGSLNRGGPDDGPQAELWQVLDPTALRVVDVLGRSLDYAILFAGPDTVVLTRTARDASNEYATFTETQVLIRADQ